MWLWPWPWEWCAGRFLHPYHSRLTDASFLETNLRLHLSGATALCLPPEHSDRSCMFSVGCEWGRQHAHILDALRASGLCQVRSESQPSPPSWKQALTAALGTSCSQNESAWKQAGSVCQFVRMPSDAGVKLLRRTSTECSRGPVAPEANHGHGS